ncbi:hypothetical protein DICPUDRAFT_100030 [Dictyostelium purpureum]|uniref:DUF3677 domain-containing protein n=1 Tax=Dictyostelium purpureum TaxID=5786 RepID=F1A4U5_DICPU|nr:uncharacterized protein DICPUDRAFT_100030 [Dictyostelium purpureum]EGC28783.1 hypothetical protein DICPUDRAFT_100030 [Dictyostelium purpureum]|eukprot:XP_003294689.1 hypothetical protein DICPUDRAFT_100030 [Dictyostelium purpureum]
MSNVNKVKRSKGLNEESSEQGQAKKLKNDTDNNGINNSSNISNNINNNPNNNNIKKSFDQNYYVDLIESEEDIENKIRIIKTILLVFRNSIGNEPDKCAYLSLLVIAKKSPSLFSHFDLLDPLLSLLKKDPTHVQKKNNLLSILACNLLMAGYDSISDWPQYLFFAYLDDAIGDRYWVEDPYCKNFVNNITMVFPQNKQQQLQQTNNTALSTTTSTTTTPPTVNKQPLALQQKIKNPTPSATNTTQNNNDDQDLLVVVEEIDQLLTSSPSSNQSQPPQQPRNRFSYCYNEIIRYIIHLIKQYIISPNQRAFIKLLSLTVGFKESRLEGSQVIDSLLNNTNVFRFSKEYLSQLLMYTTENTLEDIKTVQNLLKIQISSHQFDVVSSLLGNNSAYPAIALHQAIEMEMDGNQKVVTKSKLSTIFKYFPANRGEEELSAILKDYASREDRNVKLVIRKIFKHLSSINLIYLCEQLTNITSWDEQHYIKPTNSNINILTGEKWITNMYHLLSQLLFLLPSFYETSKELNPRIAVSYLQSYCVQWVGKLIPLSELSSTDALSLIKRFLVFEPLGSYFQASNNAADSDRNAYRILTTETPIQEVILEVIINIGTEFSNERGACLDLCEGLLKRAMSTATKVGIASNITKPSFAESFINFSRIENSDPPLAYTPMFWQSMVLSCLLVCLSPFVIGTYLWPNCPTIRTLIEMVITRSWKFPPYIPKGIQNSNIFEINEMNQRIEEKKILSKYPQLNGIEFILLDIKGPIRQPPDEIIEKLQKLENENHLGFVLCTSRQPDFLLEIMSNQDSKQSMVWLNPIIHNDPKTLDILPPICISEILLSTQFESPNANNNISQRVLSRMTLFFNSLSPVPTLEILNFFFTLLHSENQIVRLLSKKALASLVPPSPKSSSSTSTTSGSNIPLPPSTHQQLKSSLDKIKTSPTNNLSSLGGSNGIQKNTDSNLFITEDFQWLIKLGSLQWFEESQEIVIAALKKAIYIETDINAIKSYLQYLVNNQSTPYDASFPIDLSYLILDRGVTANYLMNSEIAILIFYVYLHLLQPEQQKELSSYLSSHSVVNSQQKWIVAKTHSSSTTTTSATNPKEIYIPRVVLDSVIYCLSTYKLNNSIDQNFNQQIESIINILFPVSKTNSKLETTFHNFKNQSVDEPILRSKEFVEIVLQSNIQQLIQVSFESEYLLKSTDCINYLFSHSISNISREMILTKLDNSIDEIKKQYNSSGNHEDIKKQLSQLKLNHNNTLTILKLFIKKSKNQKGSLFLNFIESIQQNQIIKEKAIKRKQSNLIFNQFLDNDGPVKETEPMNIDNISIKDQLFNNTSTANELINITIPIIKENNSEKIESYFKEIQSFNFNNLAPNNEINISLLISIIRLLNNDLIKNSKIVDNQNNQIQKLLDSLSNQKINNNNVFKQKDFLEYISKKALFKLLPITPINTPMKQSPKLHSKPSNEKVFDICKEWNIYSSDSIEVPKFKFNSKEIISELDKIKYQNLVINEINRLGYIFKNLVSLFIFNDPQRLEEFIGKFFSKLYSMTQRNNIESTHSTDVTIVIFNSLVLLLNEIGSKKDLKLKTSLGILLDWMVLLVQQFILNNQENHKQNFNSQETMKNHNSNNINNNINIKLNLDKIYFLLFGKGSFKFSTFLHSHFIHNSTWKNLKIMMQWLFKVGNDCKNGVNQFIEINSSHKRIGLDPSLVLSFINAYHQHPRSGAPYYSASNTATTAISKSVTNMTTIMDSVVMHYLNPSTIRLLSDYIVDEMDSVKILSPSKLQNRMNLLISSSMISRDNLVSLILHLSNQYTKSSSSATVIKQIYFAFPSLLKSIISNYSPFLILPSNQTNQLLLKQQPQQKIQKSDQPQQNQNNNIIPNDLKSQIPTTQLDIIFHRIILKISDVSNENRNSGFIIIRKLALIHPELISLHLPSIHSLLSGRSDTPLDQFLSRNYHHLFYQILDLLDILRPVVFNSPSLEPILCEYFTLLSSNCSSRISDFVPMISKLCDFILIFIDHNQNIDLLIQHKDIIKSLSNFYPNFQPVLKRTKPNQLTSTLNSLYSFDINYQQPHPHQQSKPQKPSQKPSQQQQQQTSQHIINCKESYPFKYIKNEKYLNENEKTAQQLDEIIKITHNVPNQLSFLKNELLLLIQSDYYNIRNMAYFLIQRYLQYCPQEVETMIGGYLNCFQHWNPDVIKDAIQHSQDFYYLSTNDRSEYLVEQILIYGGKDSISDIKKLVNPFSKIFN